SRRVSAPKCRASPSIRDRSSGLYGSSAQGRFVRASSSRAAGSRGGSAGGRPNGGGGPLLPRGGGLPPPGPPPPPPSPPAPPPPEQRQGDELRRGAGDDVAAGGGQADDLFQRPVRLLRLDAVEQGLEPLDVGAEDEGDVVHQADGVPRHVRGGVQRPPLVLLL